MSDQELKVEDLTALSRSEAHQMLRKLNEHNMRTQWEIALRTAELAVLRHHHALITRAINNQANKLKAQEGATDASD